MIEVGQVDAGNVLQNKRDNTMFVANVKALGVHLISDLKGMHPNLGCFCPVEFDAQDLGIMKRRPVTEPVEKLLCPGNGLN